MKIANAPVQVGSYVDSKHVDTLVETYKKERWIHNSKRIGKEDSLSVWHSVDELQDFINTARENGADGIKLYFGTYANDYSKNPLYAGRQTVVFVATKIGVAANGEAMNKNIHIDTEKGPQILAYNTGRICPPFCGGGIGGGGGIDVENVGRTIVEDEDGGMAIV